MNWADLISSNLEAWLAKPLPSIIALLLGGYAGFLLSRLRHQGKIDALEERIKHKDEKISIKDAAIRSLSFESHAQPKDRARTRDSASEIKGLPPMFHHDEEYAASTATPSFEMKTDMARSAIVGDAITRVRYKFVFNPATDGSKILTFLGDGTIGEGRNNNESTWRVSGGKVEILDSKGAVYSRFNLLHDGRSLHHTNEDDTRSLKGQYMVPIALYPDTKPSVHG